MDANKIETMKALALAATPGPWRVGTWSGYCGKPSHSGGRHPGPRGDDPCVYMPVFFDGGGGIGGPATDIVRCTYDGIQISETDAAHIAASNPAAVLELIAEVERLRARFEYIEDHATTSGGGHGFEVKFYVPIDHEDISCGIDAAIGLKP